MRDISQLPQQLKEMVVNVCDRFNQVVEERFMPILAKSKEFAAALSGFKDVAMPSGEFAVATPANGPPQRGGGRSV
jgi:hypothetical protein